MLTKTQTQFIEEIAKYATKYCGLYGQKFPSVVIAQACFESGYGTSELAAKANNLVGMKHRGSRVSCALPAPYIKNAVEQNKDGTYRTEKGTQWYAFESWEKCIEGYYQFTNVSAYAGLKTAKSPAECIDVLKKAVYWTSKDLDQRLKTFIIENNLTKYDPQPATSAFSWREVQSRFKYFDFGGKKCNPRKNNVSKFTPHHMAGFMSAMACAQYHKDKREASANFYIDDDTIVSAVPENYRAWTSGTGNEKDTNDHMAITVEVKNSTGAPDWKISDKAYNNLVDLGAYISAKYGIRLFYNGTKAGSITMHKQFQATSCPGPYLSNLITSGKLEKDIQARLNNITYIVKKGDTLNKIAAMYNTTAQKIADDNDIKNINLIKTGQILVIK